VSKEGVTIIGGEDGPTVVVLVGMVRVGSVIVEIIIGVLLIAAGIWGLRNSQKR